MKIIRDKIPAKKTTKIYAQSEEGRWFSELKIREETNELIHAKDKQERVEEAGDVIEALQTYLHAHEITWEEVLMTLAEKADERGRLIDPLGYLTLLAQ